MSLIVNYCGGRFTTKMESEFQLHSCWWDENPIFVYDYTGQFINLIY